MTRKVTVDHEMPDVTTHPGEQGDVAGNPLQSGRLYYVKRIGDRRGKRVLVSHDCECDEWVIAPESRPDQRQALSSMPSSDQLEFRLLEDSELC